MDGAAGVPRLLRSGPRTVDVTDEPSEDVQAVLAAIDAMNAPELHELEPQAVRELMGSAFADAPLRDVSRRHDDRRHGAVGVENGAEIALGGDRLPPRPRRRVSLPADTFVTFVRTSSGSPPSVSRAESAVSSNESGASGE